MYVYSKYHRNWNHSKHMNDFASSINRPDLLISSEFTAADKTWKKTLPAARTVFPLKSLMRNVGIHDVMRNLGYVQPQSSIERHSWKLNNGRADALFVFHKIFPAITLNKGYIMVKMFYSIVCNAEWTKTAIVSFIRVWGRQLKIIPICYFWLPVAYKNLLYKMFLAWTSK